MLSGEINNEQINEIRKQMDKFINEANEMRNKFYAAEDERVSLR